MLHELKLLSPLLAITAAGADHAPRYFNASELIVPTDFRQNFFPSVTNPVSVANSWHRPTILAGHLPGGSSMPHQRPVAIIMLAGSALAALAGYSTSEAASPRPAAPMTSSSHPVVIELYQSQGCSSCPPANADLNAIANRNDVVALSFAITYWDRLGWKDTFGSPRFTTRQQDYARAGRGEVATPEFIVNGTYAVVGSNRPALEAAIAKAGSATGGPMISTTPSGVRIEAVTVATPAAVWLVRYDPRTRDVSIRAGENGGRTLPHRNIVHELVKLGDWTGPSVSFALPSPREGGLVTAVFVQRGSGGPIVSARKL